MLADAAVNSKEGGQPLLGGQCFSFRVLGHHLVFRALAADLLSICIAVRGAKACEN
jgi:hypothetical protein